ncbi:MAG: primosomal protein N' [Proteobacteria bacterium]|nr:primosomal protein N' [Pseudomonadota bacterium]
MSFADLAIPSPIRSAFTYSVPEGASLEPGMRVLVEFRKKSAIGVVLSLRENLPEGVAPGRIKPIVEVLDESPSLSAPLLELMQWMSSYYFAPIGEAVRAALPARMLDPAPPRTTRPSAPAEIAALHEDAFLLTAEQSFAIEEIAGRARSNAHSTCLIHGVTGSGKTEVYLRLFERLAAEGRQGLLLVPEIGLTPQLAGRAAARFGERVAVYHSALTDAQRHAQWRRMRSGEVDVVIGTRSALFAPLPSLGAIVVDEEHDGSYKQDEGFTYNGRDCAVMRAHLEKVLCVLGSATPSLESAANARSGKYGLLSLGSRTGNASMPSVEIVDMRAARRSGDGMGFSSLSPALHRAISETIERGEQALLFVGRRGFASALICESCGERIGCPNCDISLCAHSDRRGDFLSCHCCDFRAPYPESCPSCGSLELVPAGHGTQRLEAEIADFFPGASVARLDSDMAGGQKERNRIFRGMRRGEIDILVGTQMVTKGHDFPGITLVGVVSADHSLHMPDFRSAERTLQLITQVAGRAGRGKKPGRVIIQTWQPEHPSIAAAAKNDFEGFLDAELAYRKRAGYPPFSKIACARVSAVRQDAARDAAGQVGSILRAEAAGCPGISILGPAPAPVEKQRNRWRWHLLVKAANQRELALVLSRAQARIESEVPRAARVSLDVDPATLM